jgi:CRISPR-associated endonuclease/helicase Cas3
MSNAENFLQRIGRLDRFGEFDEINHYDVAISEGVKRDDAKRGKSKQGDSSWFLKDELFSLRSAKAWYDYLKEHLPHDSYSIAEIYKLYDGFYSDIKSLKLIEEDLLDALEKSVELIESTVLDPKPYPTNQKEDKGGVKIKKNSLRGNSLFVQMAKCQINNLEMFERLDEYAYENIDDAMTYSSKRIEDDGLLTFMESVHHEITNTKPINKKQRKNEYRRNARNPSTPIYLSYKPKELLNIGGVSPDENALYYAIGLNDKPIGIISEQQLKNKKEINNEK